MFAFHLVDFKDLKKIDQFDIFDLRIYHLEHIPRYFNAGVQRDTLGFVTTDFIQYLCFHSSYAFSSRHYWSIRRCQLWEWRSEAAAKVDQDDFPFCGGWSPNRASVCVPWATTSRKHPLTPLFSQTDRQTNSRHFTFYLYVRQTNSRQFTFYLHGSVPIGIFNHLQCWMGLGVLKVPPRSCRWTLANQGGILHQGTFVTRQ